MGMGRSVCVCVCVCACVCEREKTEHNSSSLSKPCLHLHSAKIQLLSIYALDKHKLSYLILLIISTLFAYPCFR